MIMRLRSQYSQSGGYYYGYRRHRTWTDQQIQEAFGLTKREFQACIKARELELTPWDERKVRQALTNFVKREGRWPNTTDLRTRKDLPYGNTISRWISNIRGGWVSNGRTGLDEWIYEYAVANLKDMTPQLVFGIVNITHRREIMEMIGIEKLIRNGGGKIVQQDDFGILWKLPFREGRDSHAMYVEVINSTPKLNKKGNPIQKGGKFVYDHYFLRVPPNTRTAKDGVGWTFNKEGVFAGFAAQS
jgi:uncharacterized protein DUF6745